MSQISIDKLKFLTEQQQGLCISLYIPMIRAGAEVLQNPIRYKNLLKKAEILLQEYNLRDSEVSELLQPAMTLDQEDFWQHQDQGLAVFVSEGFLRYYQLPSSFDELVIVSDRFHLKPLLPLVTDDEEFYILTLSQKQVKFLEASRYSVREVEVEGMPKSLEEALLYDETSKDGQFRIQTSKGGASPQPGSFHGQGSPDRDQHQKDILQFFHIIDDALQEHLRERRSPLILVGVEYLLPLYREANTYPHLLEEGLTESAKVLTPEELHTRALPLIEPYFFQERENALKRYQELSDTEKTSTDLAETVAAAYYGRVEHLFVAVGVQRWGSFDEQNNELEVHDTPEIGDEDLLNSAAIQTLLNGGTVYAVEPDQVPDTAPLAAIFRY